MTNETKHTPTPWYVQDIDDEKSSEEYGSAFIIGDNLGGLVGAALPFSTELDDGDFSRVKANAAHIVKCVNMHDELVAALLRMKQWCEDEVGAELPCSSIDGVLKKAGAL